MSSSVIKHKPVYKLKIRYEAPQTGKRFVDDQVIEGNLTEWFNVHGYLDKKALRQWLAGNIEVIGLADPESKQAYEEAQEEDRVDEEVVSVGAIRSGAVAPAAAPESAKKRSRKAA